MRKMIWVQSPANVGWTCSECAWAFNPSGLPPGSTLEQMKVNFARQCEKEFALHTCAQHPRTKGKEPSAKS
jgi:hypothetical protein